MYMTAFIKLSKRDLFKPRVYISFTACVAHIPKQGSLYLEKIRYYSNG